MGKGFDRFWNNMFKGQKDKFVQQPTMTPQQQQFVSSLQPLIGNILGNLSQPFDFLPIQQKMQSNFQSQTLPGLFSMLTNVGGASPSSGYRGATLGAGQNLQESLAAMEGNYGMQSRDQMMRLLPALLTLSGQPQFQTGYIPGKPGAIPNIIGEALPYAAQAAATYFGGPGAGMAANAAAQGLKNKIQGNRSSNIQQQSAPISPQTMWGNIGQDLQYRMFNDLLNPSTSYQPRI